MFGQGKKSGTPTVWSYVVQQLCPVTEGPLHGVSCPHIGPFTCIFISKIINSFKSETERERQNQSERRSERRDPARARDDETTGEQERERAERPRVTEREREGEKIQRQREIPKANYTMMRNHPQVFAHVVGGETAARRSGIKSRQYFF